jgi:transposase
LRAAQAAPPELVVHDEIDSGAQLQAGWASMRLGRNRLSVVLATLGWSRAAYAQFVSDERVATPIECRERAFLAFGRVLARSCTIT